MCISMVFCIKPARGAGSLELEGIISETIFKYGYGSGKGIAALEEQVAGVLKDILAGFMYFEVYDVGEAHCACDIDQDIRNKSKTGEESNFFKLVKEIFDLEGVSDFAVFFADNDSVEGSLIRRETGDFGNFFERLNRWYTWQVEGYEPTRNSYYIADRSPMLFNLVPSKNH